MNPYSYIAGLIDAEGCLQINTKKRQNSHRLKYSCIITIGMRDKGPLDYVASVFPKKIYESVIKGKPFYTIRFLNTQSREVLSKVLPFLLVKREQAEIMLKVFEIKDNLPPKVTHPMTEIYDKFKNSISELKKKNQKNYTDLPKINFSEIPDDDYSYIAGLIDGDGCINKHTREYIRKEKNRQQTPRIITHLCCSIEMNQPEGILKFANIFDGNIQRREKTFKVAIHGKKMQAALEILKNYLILKRQPAQECLDYFKTHPPRELN